MSTACCSPSSLPSIWIRRLTWTILSVHAVLLLWSIPDYFPSVDHGYHVALARQYAQHGTFFWDSIHYAPEGRPNLQGPLLHYAIAGVGRVLGGSGDAFVMALAVMGFLQWAAAMWTAYYFARRYAGEVGALLGTALLSGSVFASFAFSIGLPSGWIFILTPWAIHYFLEGKSALAALFTTAAIYVHLGGIATAPMGVLVAAVLTRQWRRLLVTGTVTLALASPYIAHFLLHRAWYRGERGHVALAIAPLIYLLAVPGLIRLLRRPSQNVFLIAWSVAPAAWILQDATRFVAQSTLAGAVVGGTFGAWAWERIRPRWRAAFVAGLVAVAALYPLSLPSLAVELLWDVKPAGLPRQLDWESLRTVAGVIERDHLNDRLLSAYSDSLGSAISVYTPVRQLYGHWVEVQPRNYSGNRVPAGTLVYVLPMPPDDTRLHDFARRGWVCIHGGSARMTVVTLERRPTPDEAAPVLASVLSEECAWLAGNAVNNRMPPAGDLLSPVAQHSRRERLDAQRSRVGRIPIAMLVYSVSLEQIDPARARATRGYANTFGGVAGFLGDDNGIGVMSDARHELLLRNLARVAAEAECLRARPFMSQELERMLVALSQHYFGAGS